MTYSITVEYLINENVDIKKIYEKIEKLIQKYNGKLEKTDIIYNSNKRYTKIPKDSMFKVDIINFDKFIDLKTFINEILNKINDFNKESKIKKLEITKYCIKEKINEKNNYIKKLENNILINNISKIGDQKSLVASIFNRFTPISNNTDKYQELNLLINNYFLNNNI
jgi:hypothetical protein